VVFVEVSTRLKLFPRKDLKRVIVMLVSAGKRYLVKVCHLGVNVRTRRGHRKSWRRVAG